MGLGEGVAGVRDFVVTGRWLCGHAGPRRRVVEERPLQPVDGAAWFCAGAESGSGVTRGTADVRGQPRRSVDAVGAPASLWPPPAAPPARRYSRGRVSWPAARTADAPVRASRSGPAARPRLAPPPGGAPRRAGR